MTAAWAAALLLIASCASAGESAAAPGAGVPDPVEYIRSVYAAEIAGTPERESAVQTEGRGTRHATPRLAALFEDEARYANGEVGRLDFDYFTGAQDQELSEVVVTGDDVPGAADRKVVVARFKNMGRPITIFFYFERITDAWYLDDVGSPGYLGADDPPAWTLSLLLKYGAH